MLRPSFVFLTFVLLSSSAHAAESDLCPASSKYFQEEGFRLCSSVRANLETDLPRKITELEQKITGRMSKVQTNLGKQGVSMCQGQGAALTATYREADSEIRDSTLALTNIDQHLGTIDIWLRDNTVTLNVLEQHYKNCADSNACDDSKSTVRTRALRIIAGNNFSKAQALEAIRASRKEHEKIYELLGRQSVRLNESKRTLQGMHSFFGESVAKLTENDACKSLDLISKELPNVPPTQQGLAVLPTSADSPVTIAAAGMTENAPASSPATTATSDADDNGTRIAANPSSGSLGDADPSLLYGHGNKELGSEFASADTDGLNKYGAHTYALPATAPEQQQARLFCERQGGAFQAMDGAYMRCVPGSIQSTADSAPVARVSAPVRAPASANTTVVGMRSAAPPAPTAAPAPAETFTPPPVTAAPSPVTAAPTAAPKKKSAKFYLSN